MRTTILTTLLALLCASSTFARQTEDRINPSPERAQTQTPNDHGENDGATDSETEAKRLDPQRSALCSLLRSRVVFEEDEIDTTIVEVNEAINIDPGNAELFGLRARCWKQKKEYDKAIGDYSEALQIDPKDAQSLSGRASCWREKEEYDKAIADYSEAINIDPKNAYSFSFRAWCWMDKKEFDKAIADLTESFNIDPEVADSLSFRAHCWVQKQEYENAIADATEALRIDAKSKFALSVRAQCWWLKKDYDRAIADYSKHIEIEPNDAMAWNCRALCWRDKGDFDKALSDLDRAIKIDPKGAKYINEIAWIRATCPIEKHRDGHKAIEFATKACEQNHWKDAGHIDTLAAAYAQAGNFETAVEWQAKAIELAPEEKKAEFKNRLELYKSRRPYRQEQQQLTPYPLPSKAQRALNEIAGQSDVLILGEIHGTQEVPAVAMTLLEPFTKLGYGLLALEIPADQQGPLTDWATGKTATVPRFFTKEIEDGRGNVQVLSLIRTALSPPFRWKLICFDEPGSEADYDAAYAEAAEQEARSDTQPGDIIKLSVRRDADMAVKLAEQRQKLSPGAKVLAICGNVHARTANHSAPDDLMSQLWPSFAAGLQTSHTAWQIRSVNVVPLSGGYFAMTDPAEGELPRGKSHTIHATRKLLEAEALLLDDKDWNLELNLPRATPATFLSPAGAASRKPDSP